MAIISTFELLARPRLPAGTPAPLSNLGRNVLSGYFLTIANPSPLGVALSVIFTTRLSQGVNLIDIVDFLDTSGVNITGNLVPDAPLPSKFRYSPLFLAGGATGLLIVQPNPIKALAATPDLEVRGFVEVFLSSLSGAVTGVKLQVSAEQRGTFFSDINAASLAHRGLDQVAYSLPVVDNGSITLS